MSGRIGGRLLSTLSLLLATLAWAGFLFLHTVGDPSGAGRMATAVLDTPAARAELAGDIASSVAKQATAAGFSLSAKDPTLVSGIDAALDNPSVRANLIGAISTAQQKALGESTKGSTVINTTLLVGAIRNQVIAADPSLAQALNSVGGSVTLPAVRLPHAQQLRHLAEEWSARLALLALVGLVVAMAVGNRVGVLRRAGLWAIGAGFSWAVLPPLISGAASHWAASQAAMVKAVVRTAAGGVTATASALIVVGAAAVVLSIFGRGLLSRR